MSLLNRIKTQVAAYLRAEKTSFCVGCAGDSQLFAKLKGVTKSANTGLYRTKQLIDILENENILSEEHTKLKISSMYLNDKEPPEGLGNSKELRKFLCNTLFNDFGLTEKDLDDKYNELCRDYDRQNNDSLPPSKDNLRDCHQDELVRAIMQKIVLSKPSAVMMTQFAASAGDEKARSVGVAAASAQSPAAAAGASLSAALGAAKPKNATPVPSAAPPNAAAVLKLSS